MYLHLLTSVGDLVVLTPPVDRSKEASHNDYEMDRVASIPAAMAELKVSKGPVGKNVSPVEATILDLKKTSDPRVADASLPDEDEQCRMVANDLRMSDDSDDGWTHDCWHPLVPSRPVTPAPMRPKKLCAPPHSASSMDVSEEPADCVTPPSSSQLATLTGNPHSPEKSEKYEKHRPSHPDKEVSPTSAPLSRRKLDFYSETTIAERD